MKFSLIAAPGGKYRQAPWILQRVMPHRHWVEVFCYSAIVTFSKPPSEIETINDINGDLINFYRVYQRVGPSLIADRMKYGLNSRALFNQYKAVRDNPEASDEERAFAYWYTNRNSINTMGLAWTYGVTTKQVTTSHRSMVERIADKMEWLYQRLNGVQIECLPYHEIIKRYGVDDSVLFFNDPPYYVATKNPAAYYKKEHSFTVDDHQRLADLLRSTPARWLLSYDDLPEVRELYKGYNTEVYEYVSTMNTERGDRRIHRELLISNYDTRALAGLPLFAGHEESNG